MLNIYNTNLETNKLEEIKEFKPGSWISLINPTEDEIKYICTNLNIEEDFVRYPLDLEEQARIDAEEDMTLFIIDVPVIEKSEGEKDYVTIPLGLLVIRDQYFVTVSIKKNKIIEDFEKGKVKGVFTFKKTRFILQIFYLNAVYYLDSLKKINREAEGTVVSLHKSMKNRELIRLLSLENSLVYIATSLKANELVMEKTLKGKYIKLYEEDEEILEDALVENRQAIEMSKIYSDILAGTMDAYASIISNNLNVVMKFLASVTILISLPTLVASLWGMNVGVPFGGQLYGFFVVMGISILVSVLAYLWLKHKDMI